MNRPTIDSTAFMESAACLDAPADIFTPDTFRKDSTTQEAKAWCAVCTVRKECLEYALANNLNEGVWGGLVPRERARLPRGSAA